MGFPRQEYWSGLPFPSPGDLPDPGIERMSSALQVDSLPLNHQGSPTCTLGHRNPWVLVLSSHSMQLCSVHENASQQGKARSRSCWPQPPAVCLRFNKPTLLNLSRTRRFRTTESLHQGSRAPLLPRRVVPLYVLPACVNWG